MTISDGPSYVMLKYLIMIILPLGAKNLWCCSTVWRILRNRDPMFYCVKKPNLLRIYDVAPLPQQNCSFQALGHLLRIRWISRRMPAPIMTFFPVIFSVTSSHQFPTIEVFCSFVASSNINSSSRARWRSVTTEGKWIWNRTYWSPKYPERFGNPDRN